MQLMTWTLSRLGSRFNLLFEPYQRRVMHSALGRFLDAPLDLQVGLIEPDGTVRVLPFTQAEGDVGKEGPAVRDLLNVEQFERFNSITFRAYSETYRLRFELNIHSVFYPQDDRLCTMPAFYLEMRANPVSNVRWIDPVGDTPQSVRLVLRLNRPHTEISSVGDGGADQPGRIDLAYVCPLQPRSDYEQSQPPASPTSDGSPGDASQTTSVQAHERIVSLNPDAQATPEGDGLTLDLPVTAPASGTKWRLVWAAHVNDPVMSIREAGQTHHARFHYNRYWDTLEQVIDEAIDRRDNRLAHSRWFEKIIGQAPLDRGQTHLLNQAFQAYLSNTFWCDIDQPDSEQPRDWFAVWEGACFFLSTLDVEYNVALFYFALWPGLLELQFHNWARCRTEHEPSGGAYLDHDIGWGAQAAGQRYPHSMEVEENSNFLLLLQAYIHWTGDITPATTHRELIEALANYLIWTDRDHTGFPSEGVANTVDDSSAAMQFSRKQTYLAVKRLSGLEAAADLAKQHQRVGDADKDDHSHAPATPDGKTQDQETPDLAQRCEQIVERDKQKVEQSAWLGDHYAVSADASASEVVDAWSGKPVDVDRLDGWDAYSIYTGNGLLLPIMTGRPPLLDNQRLLKDLASADREAQGRYGDGHTSAQTDNCWISQNLWRDMLAQYLHLAGPSSAQQYWDMQVMSNTHRQSLGFIDTYINNNLCFYPRGITAIGYFLAAPRLIIDRLAPGGTYITVDPDRHEHQRWPLLPLADWRAGKIPVCVVNQDGQVNIEGQTDPVIIHGQSAEDAADRSHSPAGLIG